MMFDNSQPPLLCTVKIVEIVKKNALNYFANTEEVSRFV